jgi:hypothetical protein
MEGTDPQQGPRADELEAALVDAKLIVLRAIGNRGPSEVLALAQAYANLCDGDRVTGR